MTTLLFSSFLFPYQKKRKDNTKGDILLFIFYLIIICDNGQVYSELLIDAYYKDRNIPAYGKQIDRQIDGSINRLIDVSINRQIDGSTNRQTDLWIVDGSIDRYSKIVK